MRGPRHQVLGSRRAYEGRRVCVRRDRLRGADGREFDREVVEHPGAAAVVPLLPDGRLVLLRQYRYSIGATILELPAGTLEPGEDPEACAARELREETGYRAGKLERLGTVYPSPGILTEVLHLFLATELAEGEASPEPGEDLEVHLVTMDEAIAMVRDGRIRDAKTLAGIQLAAGADT